MNYTNLLSHFSWLSEIKLNKKQSGMLNRYAVYASVILFVLSILSFENSNAQNVFVSGANSGNGTYTTLGAAFTGINGGSQTGANITVFIINNTTETATAQLNSGSWNSITINPSGSKTISGSISGNALVRLNGADNVNIKGNPGFSFIFDNTSTTAHSTLHFVNDASNNRISNCQIKGVSTNANVVFGTGTATGNDNNVIENCDIGDYTGSITPAYAVRFDGSSSFPNNGDTIRNCRIFNFFSATTSSAGIYIGQGNSDITIYQNRFFQMLTRTITAPVTHYVIWIDNQSANNCRIIENVVGYNIYHSLSGPYTVVGNNASSKFMPIYVTGGSTSIQGNIITAINFSGFMSGAIGANPFTFIFVNWGSANIGNEKRNYLGGYFPEDSTYVTTSSTAEIDVFGIYVTGMSTDLNSSNNLLSHIRVSGGGIVGIQLIRRFRATPYNWTCQNNEIGDLNNATSIINTSSNTASFTTGIYGTNAGPSNVVGNTIRNMTAAGGTIYGINLENSNSQNISQNTIYNLKNTNTTQADVISGIHFLGGGTYEKNFIHSLSASSSSATINGIYATGGPCNINNNMIRLGITSTGSGLNTGTIINGINENIGSNSFYYNSVYIGGNPTSTANSTYALKSASVSASRNYVNNIFFNARSNSGSTGKHYAIQLASNSCTSKNNDLYVTGTGGVLGFYSTDRTDLNAWKTATLLDTNSLSGNPNFINPTGDYANINLHIDTLTSSPVNGAGVNIPGINTDYDGNVRSALTPDIGADEFRLKIKLNLTVLVEGLYNASTNLQVSDTIKVCLRNSNSPYNAVDTMDAVLSDSGKAFMTFLNSVPGNYYLQIKNRNALETWNANPVSMTEGGTTLYDFTTAASKAFGNNMKLVDTSPIKFAIFSSDVDQNGSVDAVDLGLVEYDAFNFVTGYVNTDVTGDNIVDGADLAIVDNNAFNFVSVSRP